MLNMYQLWLDDLYPRAKFADALTIIEKVGHTKGMQMRRKEWIDEGKPRRTTEQDKEAADVELDKRPSAAQDAENMDGVEHPTESHNGAPVLAEGANSNPDDDELDALLAEGAQSESATAKTLPVRTTGIDDDPFADEMEAMADMEGMW